MAGIKVLHLEDVMEVLGISRESAKALSRRSDFKAIFVSDRNWFIRETDLEAWLEQQAELAVKK